MSKRALSLLKDLGLLRGNLPADLHEITNEALAAKLHSYFDERTKNLDSDINGVNVNRDLSCLISSFSARNCKQTILPSSLIHKHMIADDPV
jgi:hypothetical protein